MCKSELYGIDHSSNEYILGIYSVNIYEEHQDIIVPIRRLDYWKGLTMTHGHGGTGYITDGPPSQEQKAQEGFLERTADPNPQRELGDI